MYSASVHILLSLLKLYGVYNSTLSILPPLSLATTSPVPSNLTGLHSKLCHVTKTDCAVGNINSVILSIVVCAFKRWKGSKQNLLVGISSRFCGLGLIIVSVDLSDLVEMPKLF